MSKEKISIFKKQLERLDAEVNNIKEQIERPIELHGNESNLSLNDNVCDQINNLIQIAKSAMIIPDKEMDKIIIPNVST